VLAIDPGSKRVGLAVSDPTGTIAQALATVPAEPRETLVSRLAKIAGDQEVRAIVVGLPRRMDGSYGPEAKAARELASQLRHASEFFTSRVFICDRVAPVTLDAGSPGEAAAPVLPLSTPRVRS